MDPRDYNITLRKVEMDGNVYFEARVRELPDLVEYAENSQDAYELALDSIATTAEVLASSSSKRMPDPFVPVEDFSGRITLRMTKTLHRSMAVMAESEGVSLNSYITSLLAGQDGIIRATKWHSNKVRYQTAAIPKQPAANKAFTLVRTSTPRQKEDRSTSLVV
jgi:hypothetical protein